LIVRMLSTNADKAPHGRRVHGGHGPPYHFPVTVHARLSSSLLFQRRATRRAQRPIHRFRSQW
jgi:hypothetical protein